VPGIDNAAHIGGFLSGVLLGMTLARPLDAAQAVPWRRRLAPGGVFLLVMVFLATHVPEPRYRWSEEAAARQEISRFLRRDATASSAWQRILEEGQRGGTSFDELAGRVDEAVAGHYEQSFEQLSRLHLDPGAPSAAMVESLRHYAGQRLDASRAMAEGLRARDAGQIRGALDLAQRAGQRVQPGGGAAQGGDAALGR